MISYKLIPGEEFEFNEVSDSLMRIKGKGVRKLVDHRWSLNKHQIHASLIPDRVGVVQTAIVTLATDERRPGFWYVVLDSTGRPVAEYPLTYSRREVEPELFDDTPPAVGSEAVTRTVETTGDLCRILLSWFVSQDRVNDDDSAAILEKLSVHALSPLEVRITIKSRRMAQRFYDELLCFEDDVNGIPGAVGQSTELRESLSRLSSGDTV
jgi:hypothetical protein